MSAEQELSGLLGESREEAARRAAARFSLRADDALVLYGAGGFGRVVLERLRRVGIEPAAFADDTPAKQNTEIDRLPVLTPQAAIERFGPRVLFVVTVLNPALSFLAARRRLEDIGARRVVSFLEPAWKYPAVFLPYLQYEPPQDLLARSQEISAGLGIWEDEESRRQYVGHVRFRLHLDYEALPENARTGYFPADVPLDLSPETTFIDCGAYDGDTLRNFLEHQRGEFRAVHAFEPDAENCRRLRAFVAGLGEEIAHRIYVYHAGVGSRRERLPFQQTGGTGSRLGEGGGAEVEVVPIDEVVGPSSAPLFIKFDVEGAEWEALAGAEHLIQQTRPTLALSVYHRPEDLWRLPLRLKSLAPDYRLFLRTQGEDGMDAICFAVPRPS
jgi:FkbM family methyltransferase